MYIYSETHHFWLETHAIHPNRPPHPARHVTYTYIHTYLLRALPVKAPQQDGAHRHRGRVPQLGQEARALQRDVRPAHAEGLAWFL